ncbi:MAG: DUF4197 domain-containing protein [Chitinophagaceae bacterium]|nr:DUF4197 domain-containing protein [Chitinophagaceae bacterium]
MKILMTVGLFLMLTGCEPAQQILSGMNTGSGPLTSAEIASGLKEALRIGTQNGTGKLSVADGFFANAAVKILMPEEAKKVESSLRNLGLGSLVDKAILSMNRAAEDAAKYATPIFVDAIKSMTISDAMGILRGGNYAATDYFKEKTTLPLTNAFRPVIEKALTKVDATKYWNDVFSAYNKFAANPVNTDLTAYVTGKALDGIFHEVGQEELKIRKDPAARVTELLKKVFGSNS